MLDIVSAVGPPDSECLLGSSHVGKHLDIGASWGVEFSPSGSASTYGIEGENRANVREDQRLLELT